MSEPNRGLEAWLPVVGYEGTYQVSDHGRVLSESRQVRRSNMTTALLRPKILTPSKTPKGYLVVGLVQSGGRSVKRRVHRLVLEAFVGPCPLGQEGCHKHGDPSNNRLENLYWGTKPENAQDQVRHGTHFRANLTSCPYEHALVPPNVIIRASEGDRRKCWSCQVIRQRNAYEKRCGRPLLDHKIASDELYAALLESGGAIRGAWSAYKVTLK